MRELEEAFERARSRRAAAFVAYMTGGFPDRETSLQVLTALAEEGADVIEVGVPFSDPIADGVTIQEASQIALSNGATPRNVLETVARLRRKVDVPVVLMSYLNVAFRYGLQRFAEDARSCGVSAVIFPDLPLEELGPIAEVMRGRGLGVVLLGSPVTRDERLARILDASDCFTYLVSVTGVTGERSEVPRSAIDLLRRAKSLRPKSRVAVGFGVSSPEHGALLSREGADGVVVGSKLVSIVRRGTLDELRDFVREFRNSLVRSHTP
ncbi:MAG: tryptophan synthase subunit alpha [Nitrososphaerota archaeon]